MNNLREWLKIDKAQAEELIAECKIDIMARGETLGTQEFVNLSTAIKEKFFNN